MVASARATDPKPTTDTIASISDQVRRKALPAAASQSSSTTAKKQPADQLADVPNLFGTKNREAARAPFPTSHCLSPDSLATSQLVANLSKDSFLQILKGKSGA